MQDDFYSALEIGMVLQLSKDLVDAHDELIEKHEKINKDLLKMVALHSKFIGNENMDYLDESIQKNHAKILELKKQRDLIDKYKKQVEKAINNLIDEDIVDSEKNLRFKAFLYDWQL